VPDLSFQVERAEVLPFAASPQLAFKLRVGNRPAAEPIHAVMLQCQVRLEPNKRRYQAAEHEGLRDLFGEPERWGQTMRSTLWTHSNVLVPPFEGSVVVDLMVPCSYDFNVAATKYFHALQDGDVPLLLLFSGTIFHQAEDGRLQVAQVPWNREANFRFPVGVWRDMMDHYYPNSSWLRLRQDVFDALYRYKVRHGLVTWEQALERLLAGEKSQDKP
jgi:Family of unknown function (DUF6084)